MADSVVKLKLDSGEYDSKIRRAAQNVLSFGENCQKAGQSVAKADKETLDYVRAIGQMETVSKNAKGKINEMTTAFTDLSVQYRNLTDEEKKSQFGVALSQSLDQLKTRINDSKAQLADVNNELGNTSRKGNETGGVMQQLASKFTINLDAIKLFNAGISVIKIALDVAKDAFFASESSADEWGRTIESGRAIYDSFLQTLNSGNFGNFFANLDNVIAKARAAHDAIDDLNTAMTIINPERAKLQTRQTQLQSTIRRQGANSEAGRKAQEELKALEPRLQSSYRTEAGMNWNAFTALVDEKLATAGINLDKNSRDFLLRSFHSMDAYERLKRNARGSRTYQGGESIGTTSYGTSVDNGRWVDTRNTNQKLLDLFTDEWRQQNSGYLTASFNALGQSYGMLRGNARYLNSGTGGGGSRGGTGGTGGGSNIVAPPPVGSIAEQEAKVQALTKAWREASDQVGRDGYAAQLKEAKAVLDEMQGKVKEVIPEGSFKALNQELHDLQSQRELLSDPIDVAITDDMIQQVKDKIDELNGKKKETSEPPQRASIEDQIRTKLSDQNTATDATTFTNLLEFQIKNGLENVEIPKEYLQQAIFGERMNIPDEYWQDLVDQINAELSKLGIDPIKLNVETGEIEKVAKQTKNSWNDAANAIMSVGSALQQLQDPAAKIAGIVGEAIATIALAFAQASAKETKSGIWGWIAATAVGLGTMISTIDAIKSATAGNYAQGGTIPGNSFSGDNQIMIGTNAGELILNRAQQANIAGQLTNNGLGSLHLEASLDGEDIRLAVRNGNRRRGRGEYVESKS